MLQQLVEIHNNLCQINTKGEDTITMARCLLALRQLVQQIQEDKIEEEKEDADNNS